MSSRLSPALRRAAATLVSTAVLGASLAAPAAAQDSAGSGEVPGSAVGSGDIADLLAAGSASNANAPFLAPLSVGLGPLSAAPDTGPNGSVVVPSLMGATLLLSLVPVGSIAAATQAAGSLGGEALVDNAAGSLTGAGIPNPAPDPSIDTVEVLSKTPVEDARIPGRLEIWTVTSAAMGRKVELEVYLPGGDAPAPILYTLDGIDTLMPSSYRWLSSIPRRAALEGFTAVAPTGATASNFTDWIADDPRLGRNKWETFLNEELPPLLESDPRLRYNGKRGITGISMGAGAALQVAGSDPSAYAAAAGVSGCYSTLSDLGYETLRLSIETRGGNLDNMWGPRGSEQWQQHNLPDHPERFRDMTLFLSSATGAIGRDDAEAFGNDPGVLFSGYALEAGTYECTNEFASALEDAGVEHELYLRPTGIHNWTTFGPSLDRALDVILPALR